MTCEVIDWPRVGPEEHPRRAVRPKAGVMLDVMAVASQELPGHHHEGLVHVLTLLRPEEELRHQL